MEKSISTSLWVGVTPKGSLKYTMIEENKDPHENQARKLKVIFIYILDFMVL